jgi:hypothetical protein
MSPAKPGVASTDILEILAVTCQTKEKDIGDISPKKLNMMESTRLQDLHTEFMCERTL